MKLDDIKELIYESLEEPVCELGCAGPPECKIAGCSSEGKHDTGLSMCAGEIYIEIDDKVFQVSVKQIPKMP